jgi:RHS repeat-associated protein
LSSNFFNSTSAQKGTSQAGKNSEISSKARPGATGATSGTDKSVSTPSTIPSISLPKGGGAIRGIGEKFTANPVTGTGSLSVPIFTSPGRSGFGPQLSLSYDSGSGNGPFGFGWGLSLPSITRKTDKGLPMYQDAADDDESDVFILSAAEDLVPVFKKDEKGEWELDKNGNYIIDEDPDRDGYIVRRYRPRIEGLFARIERWTRRSDGDTHWRSISKDNVLTVYGRDEKSRIYDPVDKSRVFSWLICESYDDKGNAIVYKYAAENDKGIDLSHTNEQNRLRTANRYIKRIWYGNRQPLLLDINNKPSFRKSHLEVKQTELSSAGWMFEVVFDYVGEDHYIALPFDSMRPEAEQHRFVQASAKSDIEDNVETWSSRPDTFSTYRAGFEVRTYRRCQRVLMFHRFPELGNEPYLVRSTEFDYSDFDYSQGHQGQEEQEEQPIAVKAELEYEGSTRFASFIQSVTQSGYVLDKPMRVINGFNYLTYLKKSLPPLEFEYSLATIHEDVKEVDEAQSLENLPSGLDGTRYQWADLDGEGLSGILTEQAGAWFYKRNISGLPIMGDDDNGKPVTTTTNAAPRFAPIELLKHQPSPGNLGDGGQQQRLMDLSGDGQLDLVQFNGPLAGFFERTTDEKWETFVPFTSLPNVRWDDPNLKFIDLTGDGHADILITENCASFVWYQSLAEQGFVADTTKRVHHSLDEEKGPRLVFADGTQSIYLADMSGDGLTDLVRILNGEVCYWPNLGYGHFGAKVTMDNAPWFDTQDQFDQRRIRLADMDGSGVTDIIYLSGRNGLKIYFNQSGNRWSNAHALPNFPHIDNLSSSIQAADLLGNGTVCLVWSSALPTDSRRPMRYIDFMGGQKPHLLVGSKNNLGAETRIHYAASTKFYLADKAAGKPWITRLPFPVHVVERVETYDWISRNRFVTRYAYHHGYFDGEEREFRGFGMVEQYDTEELAALSSNNSGLFPTGGGDNIEASSHVPPVLTKTWFHIGIYLGRDHISNFFAGLLNAQDRGEYYREPELTDTQAQALLLPDTELPTGLSLGEEREACRALKGAMLRQEIYALDDTPKAAQPYTVTEQNFTIRRLQPRGHNRHAVFFTHAREAVSYQYERNPADPRISHTLTLEVNNFGNVLKQVSVGYGRRQPDPNPLLLQTDHDNQTRRLITYSKNRVTNAIDLADNYRTPLSCENRTYELTGYTPTDAADRFQFADFVQQPDDPGNPNVLIHIFDDEINYEDQPTNGRQRRLIEQVRTLYPKNDLTGLLPLDKLESLALQGETYKLAFTPGLLTQVFQRDGQLLLPNPADVLGGQGADHGGYLSSQQLKAEGKFPNTDPDGYWWIPSGRVFYSPPTNNSSGDPAAQEEREYARQHFFLPHRYRDPFHTDSVSTESIITFDAYDLLMLESRDPLGSRITVGERLPDGEIDPNKPGNDYCVLQPRLVTDPNRNRIEVTFDTLGMVAGTAVKGKVSESAGDTLNGFEPDTTDAELDAFYDVFDPHEPALSLLKGATSRVIYDLHRFRRTQEAHPEDPTKWLPVYAATLARETHVSDLPQQPPLPPGSLRIQISFSYSDGFEREIQKKIQAEPGPLVDDGPVVSPRWVGSGWTVFNNKGKPVRQYEPFFSHLPEKRHYFEFGVQVGVSPILFYDPVERVVATLHPNHTYEKVVFDSWHQKTYDVNDTVISDPRIDEDIHGYVAQYFATLNDPTWRTWYQERIGGERGREEQKAAQKTEAHANTPTMTYFDTLGRPFLTLAHNRFKGSNDDSVVDETYATRVELDIEGNECKVRDAVVQNGDQEGRIVMRYDYDMLGNRIHQLSMEADARWMLNDVAGKSIRAWDSRDHTLRIEYDPLRRPLCSFVIGADPSSPNQELLTERMVYGEQHPEDELYNMRGKLYLHLDQAGVETTERYDFKGNPLHTSRQLAKQYKQAVSWRAVDDNHDALPTRATEKLDSDALKAALAPLLKDDETFNSHTIYDALNRPIQIIFPHSSKPGTKLNVTQPVYNEANLLERIDAWLEIDSKPAALLDPNTRTQRFIRDIDYNAKGQRELIEHGNGVTTTYEYDRLTFRLVHLQTLRGLEKLQDLFYFYDPAGNIVSIHDDAQQTIFFNGQVVKPDAEYTYDAIYRLIEATGREHLGQIGGAPIPHSHNDAPRVGLLHPNDGRAMGSYIERYIYDAVGNLLEMQHRGTSPTHPGWTHHYAYDEPSLIEDGTAGTLLKTSNRLSSTTVGGIIERYKHDLHGNIERMPHLENHPDPDEPNMHWDFRDQLNQVDLGGGGTAYYVYDGTGQRIRKVHEHIGALIEERIYLGSLEVYRKYNGSGLKLERETLHVMDNKQRIALVETHTIDTAGNDPVAPRLIRYQLSNHLGSASLELDDQVQIISYEEYTPYGSTSYQAVSNVIKISKQYRYTGKERDEENGLYYHGARYYAPWLGRWISCDPAGLKNGDENLYEYVSNNPMILSDPTGREKQQSISEKFDVVPKLKEPLQAGWLDKPSSYVHFLETAAYQLHPRIFKIEGFSQYPYTGNIFERKLKEYDTIQLANLNWKRYFGDYRQTVIDNLSWSANYGGLAGGGIIAKAGASVPLLMAQSEIIGAVFGGLGRLGSAAVGRFISVPAERAIEQAAKGVAKAESATIKASFDRILLRARNQAHADIGSNPGLTDRAYGNMLDARFKQIVEELVKRGELPSTIRTTPRFVYGADVIDIATRRAWDLTTRRAWIQHELRYGMIAGRKHMQSVYSELTPILYIRP